MCYLSSDRFILLFVKIKTRKKITSFGTKLSGVALFFLFLSNIFILFLSKLKAIVLIQYENVSGVAMFYTSSNSEMVLTYRNQEYLKLKLAATRDLHFSM